MSKDGTTIHRIKKKIEKTRHALANFEDITARKDLLNIISNMGDLLEKNGITVNKNGIPNDPRNFVETSGIRIGTAAETTRGNKAYWFRELAQRIVRILNG